ncbi:hypothetical protein AAULR_25206, partial [Lacticaseibacillus rhamnosus MTCC 5462]
ATINPSEMVILNLLKQSQPIGAAHIVTQAVLAH